MEDLGAREYVEMIPKSVGRSRKSYWKGRKANKGHVRRVCHCGFGLVPLGISERLWLWIAPGEQDHPSQLL